MNDDDQQQLEDMKKDLLEITSGDEALASMNPTERAGLLMFRLKSTENPTLDDFKKVRETIDQIEDPEAKIDVALDLMGQIDLATGALELPDDTDVTGGDDAQEESNDDAGRDENSSQEDGNQTEVSVQGADHQ